MTTLIDDPGDVSHIPEIINRMGKFKRFFLISQLACKTKSNLSRSNNIYKFGYYLTWAMTVKSYLESYKIS